MPVLRAAVRLFLPWAGRDLTRQWLIAIASVLALALGVSVFVAIRLANRNASASFEAALQLLTGRSDLEISAADAPLPEQVWADLQDIPGLRAATPLLSGVVTLPELQNVVLRLNGIDPFTSSPFREAESGGRVGKEKPAEQFQRAARDWLSSPAKVGIDRRVAQRLGIQAGEQIVLNAANLSQRVRVAALVDPLDAASPENTLWADIGWAQEILQRQGQLDSIQIQAQDPKQLDSLSHSLSTLSSLPTEASVGRPNRRSANLESLLKSYQLNLSCMALVSLLVGAYLVYGSLAATVSRRSREIAILRSLGIARPSLILLVLGQALILACAGILIGIPLGIYLGRGLLEGIREGILLRFIAESGSRYQILPGEILLAATVGLLAALAGAAIPALESLRHLPIHALRPHLARSVEQKPHRWLLPAGAVALLLCVLTAILALTVGPRWFSFLSCLLLVIAFTCWLQPLSRLLLQVLAALLRLHPLASLAVANLSRSLKRYSLTMMGLVTALAMVGSVEVMIHSFRSSVDGWINTSLSADFFAGPLKRNSARLEPLNEAFVEQARTISGVAAVETLSQVEAELENSHRYLLNVLDSPGERHRFALVRGEKSAQAAYYRGEGVLISEALARNESLKPGDKMILKSPQGPQALPVLGVITDYSDDVGRIYLARAAFNRHWPEAKITSLALYLGPGQGRFAVRAALEAAALQHGAEILDRKQLRKRALTIFDATFRITYALRIIAILVAILGAFALITIQLRERASETATLRAQGGSTRQIFLLHLWEGGLTGLITGLLGTLCGVGLAVLLTHAVMRTYFGWSVGFSIPWQVILFMPLSMVLAVLLAVVLPSWRASRLPLINALREE